MKKPTLTSLKNKCWKLFSEYIRRKDADAGGTAYCYTCGVPKFWKELHAGHALPGRHNAVLLDEEIVRPQCPVCNVWKGGRYEIFAAKLIREKGLEWFEGKLLGARAVVKISRTDYEEKIIDLKARLAELNEREGLAEAA